MKDLHPLTELIPERADQDEVAFDIAQSGLRDPIILYEGRVIEGRVRQRACVEVGVFPQYRDWVLFAEGDVLDWMVRHHISSHSLTEVEKISLIANVLPYYHDQPGSTHTRLSRATGIAIRKVRVIDWLSDANALSPVLIGEKSVLDAGREIGLVPDKRGVALGKSYGAGDKFDEVMQPLKRYAAAWKRKGYEFRHVNPKEASRRVSLIDSAVAELLAMKEDLEKRAVALTYTAPPERRTRE